MVQSNLEKVKECILKTMLESLPCAFIEHLSLRHPAQSRHAAREALATFYDARVQERIAQSGIAPNDHRFLGIVFEELARCDPTLQNFTILTKQLEDLYAQVANDDLGGVFQNQPPGSCPDAIVFNEQEFKVVLHTICEIKLSSLGVSRAQLLREEQQLTHVVKALNVVGSENSYLWKQVILADTIERIIVLPRGELKEIRMPGWIIRESFFSYADVVDITHNITGTRVADWNAHPDAYFEHSVWETLEAMKALSQYTNEDIEWMSLAIAEELNHKERIQISESEEVNNLARAIHLYTGAPLNVCAFITLLLLKK